MKGLIVFGILAFLVAGLFVPGDSKVSIADTNVPDSEITNSTNQTLSANATITIIMTTPPLPEE